MSQENVEVVLAASEAYDAGDLDAALRFYAPDVEVLPDPTLFPESAPLHGLSEFRAWLEEIATDMVNQRTPTTEVLDLGGERVLQRFDWGGVGASSGITMHTSLTAVFTMRNGLISRVQYFFDHDMALKAVGLAE